MSDQSSSHKNIPENELNSDQKKIFSKSEFSFAIYNAFRRLTQVFLVVIILGIIAVAALWLRLQTGPINLDFAKPKLQELINDQIVGYSLNFESINLIWPDIKKPFLIDIDNVDLFQEGDKVTNIKDVQLGVSSIGLIRGKVRPTFIKLVNPEIILVEKNGALSICCRLKKVELPNQEEVTEVRRALDLEYIRQNAQNIFQDILNDDLKGSYRIFQSLKDVELENVKVFWKEEEQTERQIGVVDLFLEENRDSISISLKGVLNSEDGIEQIIDSFVVYRGEQNDLTVSAKVEKLNAVFWNKFLPENNFLKKQNYILNGDIQAAFDEKFKLTSAQLDVSIPDGVINLEQSGLSNIMVKGAVLNGYINRAQNTLRINEFSGNVAGIEFESSSDGKITNRDISAPINLSIPSVKAQKISDLIPPEKGGFGALSWPKSRLKDGVFKDIKASLVLNINRDLDASKTIFNAEDIIANFSFEDMTIAYSNTLPPAKNAKGTGSYKDKTLNVEASSANISDIQSDKVVFNMTNNKSAALEINAKGPAKSVFNYLKNEPIALKDIGFETNSVQGNVAAKINIDFPIKKNLKGQDFNVKVSASLSDMLIPNIVRNLPLTGGPYQLSYNDKKLDIQGSGQLASRPITINWKQDIANKTINLNANTVSDTGFRKAFGVDINKYLSGSVPLKIVYKDIKGTKTFDVNADLLQSTINIDEIGFKKEANIPGSLALKGMISGDSLKEIDGLNVKTEGLNLQNGRLLFKKNTAGKTVISRGALKDITLGENKLSAEFETTPQNELKAVINASYLNANPFFVSDKTTKVDVKNEPQQALKLSLSANSMLMKNDVTAKNVKIYYETDATGKANQIEMDAVIGKGNTIIRFKPAPQVGNKTIMLEAADAGAFLNAVGTYKNVRNGFLKIEGTSSNQNSDTIIGKARIDNFTVKDAPVLAKLINTLSLPGILGLLTNEGLKFARLESAFEWRFRDQGDLIVVKDGRSSGASLGLTFEGIVNRESKSIDFSGNVIPMSEVNDLIGGIPVIGDILTGGDALLAATYSVKGPTSDPKVMVNPLAALAPGFLRKILFEEDVEKKIKKAE